MNGKLQLKFDFSLFMALLLLLMIVLYNISRYSFNETVNAIYYLDYSGNFFSRIRENIFITSIFFLNILMNHYLLRKTIDSGNIYKYIRNRNTGKYYSKYMKYIILDSVLFVIIINLVLFLCIGKIDLNRAILQMVFLLFIILTINLVMSIFIVYRIQDNYCIGFSFLVSLLINLEIFSGVFSQDFVKIKILLYCIISLIVIVSLILVNKAVLSRREFY